MKSNGRGNGDMAKESVFLLSLPAYINQLYKIVQKYKEN